MPATASASQRPAIGPRTETSGMHRLLPIAFEQRDLTAVWMDASQRIAADETDAAAMIDLSMILQCQWRGEEARAMLDRAVALQKDFCVVHGDGSGPKVLAFVTPGDFMANTPVDFLLNGSDAVLWLRYVDADTTDLDHLPDHDVALLAIGEATEHRAVLARMADLLPRLAGPVLNADPRAIARLTRDGVSTLLAAEPSLMVPRTDQIDRAALESIGHEQSALGAHVAGLAFPVIVRPLGTHAGGGLDRLETAEAALDYLATQTGHEFFVAPFIDYRDADGLFSKQRIVFIGGKAFPSHLALSDHWIVHYLSAGMAESSEKRAVEAAWMAQFDDDFAHRHADAFAALNQRVGLDYYGIDCAEMPDGRLLIFEVDVAMLVHDMDDAELFPYKKIAMQRLFDAFVGHAATVAAGALDRAA